MYSYPVIRIPYLFVITIAGKPHHEDVRSPTITHAGGTYRNVLEGVYAP
jgi:hypothetical protein